ncbi:MAG: hypothetical protein ACI9MR_004581 [Myxococcota bacterium]|jgi:hypothetical protein
MRTQQELDSLTREVLAGDYVQLAITKYTLTEDIADGTAWIVCQLVEVGKGPLCAVEGKGVGFVDALFDGLKSGLMPNYPSLGHIHFVDFRIHGEFERRGSGASTKVPSTVKLSMENSDGRAFEFTETSASISASSVNTVIRGVEHFVNAELAVLRVLDWIDDARRRSRPDLAETYTQRLAELVKNASYSETIERKKTKVSV